MFYELSQFTETKLNMQNFYAKFVWNNLKVIDFVLSMVELILKKHFQ